MKTSRLHPVDSPTLAEVVLKEIRASIVTGRFAPGERLVEADLARSLGISRGPIREALADLERDGIVVRVPRQGTFVRTFDARLVDEVYSLRKILEQYTAEQLVQKMDSEIEASLRRSLATIEEAADRGDLAALAERDLLFHNSLYRLSGHVLLRQAWEDCLAGKLRMLVNVTTRTHLPPADATVNHRLIVEAIVGRDAKLACALVSEHIDDGWRRASQALAGAVAPDEGAQGAGLI
jgi:DNA-binding GntR family transcriptional regulator